MALVDACVSIDQKFEVAIWVFDGSNFVIFVHKVPMETLEKGLSDEPLIFGFWANPRLLRSVGNATSDGRPVQWRRNMSIKQDEESQVRWHEISMDVLFDCGLFSFEADGSLSPLTNQRRVPWGLFDLLAHVQTAPGRSSCLPAARTCLPSTWEPMGRVAKLAGITGNPYNEV